MNENNGEIKKMMIILSKGTLENVYAAFVLANGARMEGIEAEMFFTFFGLEAVHKKKLEHLHVATVGNPAMHMPTMLGGLPGMEALAPDLTESSNGSFGSANFLPIVFSIWATLSLTSSLIILSTYSRPFCVYSVHASVVMVKPVGTGISSKHISARFAPLPPNRFFMPALPSV